MSAAIVVAPLALAAVLIFSGLAKRHHTASTRSVIVLLRLPKSLQAAWVAPALPWAEIALGLLLVITPAPLFWIPAAAALALMVTYWIVIARAMTFSPRPTCGCFGQIGDQQVSGRTLARNTLLVGAGLLAVTIAATSGSTLSLLVDFEVTDLTWLIASLGAVVLTAFIVHRPAQHHPAAAAAATGAGASSAEQDVESASSTDEPLDYIRNFIPHTVVLDSHGQPATLRETSMQQAHLLVFVNCYCPSTTATAQRLVDWRAAVPAIKVSLVWSVPAIDLHAPDSAVIDIGDHFIDHAAVAWNTLNLTGSPSGVLLGTDGMLAGGPVSGIEEIEALVEEIAQALADFDPDLDAQPSGTSGSVA